MSRATCSSLGSVGSLRPWTRAAPSGESSGGRGDAAAMCDGTGVGEPVVALPAAGTIGEAKVLSIKPYGAFVEYVGCAVHGLVHISQLRRERVEAVDEAFALPVLESGLDDTTASQTGGPLKNMIKTQLVTVHPFC